MRQLIVSEFVSIDGVFEAPEKWVFKLMNDEIGAFKLDEMREIDAMLLGKATYREFARSWPSRTGELAELMNGTPKWVATAGTEELAWRNSHRLGEGLEEEVAELKRRPGKGILVVGSGRLVRALIERDLVDELRLLLFPIVLGAGRHLLEEGVSARFRLAEAKRFDTGVVLLRYARDTR